MLCPNRECRAAVDENTDTCPECGAKLRVSAPREPDRASGAFTAPWPHEQLLRRLAGASLVSGCLAAFFLILLVVFVTVARPESRQWHTPFVLGLAPLAYFPMVASALATLGAAMTAVFAGLAALVVAVVRRRRGPRIRGVLASVFTGVAIGILAGVLAGLPLLAYFGHLKHNNDGVACSRNFRELSLLLREYASQNGDMYPPLSPEPGVLMFTREAVPAWKDGIGWLLTCPTARHAKRGTATYAAAHTFTPPFDDQSYYYLGYAVLDDDDVEAFARAYRKKIAEGGTFQDNLVVEDGEGTRVLYRLRPEIQGLWKMTGDPHSISPYGDTYGDIPDFGGTTSDVPILIERGPSHIYTDWNPRPRYAHVLYARGEVRSVEWGTWPMTEKTLSILEDLAEEARQQASE